MALDETGRRRTIQAAYNARHGIVPTSIKKDVLSLEYATRLDACARTADARRGVAGVYGTEEADGTDQIQRLEMEMKAAAKELEFERAAALRNRIRALRLRELN